MPVLLTILIAIVALAIVGWVVVGLAFKLLWWALIGVFIGALARLVLPGRQPIGALATAGSGIGGALLGGIVATAADLGGILQFLVAIIAAAGIVTVVDRTQPREPRALTRR